MSLDAAPSRVQADTPRLVHANLRLWAELRRRAAATADGTVTVSLDELAAALDVSRRAIHSAYKDLVAADLIEVSRPKPGWRHPNTYRLL